ncbi:hypothetical protein B7767_28380 [Streptomyces sp. 13-12-16]|nr:hypothetical protein B7767_28380 [Streptomyces sp. 13-12-16]
MVLPGAPTPRVLPPAAPRTTAARTPRAAGRSRHSPTSTPRSRGRTTWTATPTPKTPTRS